MNEDSKQKIKQEFAIQLSEFAEKLSSILSTSNDKQWAIKGFIDINKHKRTQRLLQTQLL